jgi:hypothetical protein
VIDRSNTAHFLLGFFAALTCAVLGLFESLALHYNTLGSILVFTLIPLAGALKSRQRVLTAGLLTGFILSLIGYFVLKPNATLPNTHPPRPAASGKTHPR